MSKKLEKSLAPQTKIVPIINMNFFTEFMWTFFHFDVFTMVGFTPGKG